MSKKNSKKFVDDFINDLYNENERLEKENRELKDRLNFIFESYEKHNGMDIRNADWFPE